MRNKMAFLSARMFIIKSNEKMEIISLEKKKNMLKNKL